MTRKRSKECHCRCQWSRSQNRSTCNGAFLGVLGGGEELGGRCFDIALPVLAGEHRAATLTPVGCRRGEPGGIPGCARGDPLTYVSPRGVAESADVALLPGVYFRPPLSCLPLFKEDDDRALQQRPY